MHNQLQSHIDDVDWLFQQAKEGFAGNDGYSQYKLAFAAKAFSRMISLCTEVDDETRDLRDQLYDLESDKEDLEHEMRELRERNLELSEKLAAMEKDYASLEKDYTKIKEHLTCDRLF